MDVPHMDSCLKQEAGEAIDPHRGRSRTLSRNLKALLALHYKRNECTVKRRTTLAPSPRSSPVPPCYRALPLHWRRLWQFKSRQREKWQAWKRSSSMALGPDVRRTFYLYPFISPLKSHDILRSTTVPHLLDKTRLDKCLYHTRLRSPRY